MIICPTNHDTGLELSLFSPQPVRIQAGFLPCLVAQSTDHIPCLAASVFKGSLGGNTVFSTDDSAVWAGQGEDSVDEASRLGGIRTMGSFVEIDEHDHGGVHWLVVAGPAPLERLEVGIAS